ncbi:PIG-L deacetylase family protein [Streptomyces sp. A30]|uniref:PIG-L deacetylase family protein n=1 Tax=Streptomyces sp. A30 TaxID=2789273 RepID=UPI003980812B
MSTVLVVTAHPADELLGPGATLARHALFGDEVHAIVLTEGATSRDHDDQAEALATSAKRAARVLGLVSSEVLLPSGQRLGSVPLTEVTQRVEEVVDGLRPEVVYTHVPADSDADHGITARATWTACGPYMLPRLKRFAVFETPSTMEWAWLTQGTAFNPALYVDVTQTLDDKLDAVSCYDTELRDYPHPRSLRALRERAAYWGSRVGRPAVEPFQVLREVC